MGQKRGVPYREQRARPRPAGIGTAIERLGDTASFY